MRYGPYPVSDHCSVQMRGPKVSNTAVMNFLFIAALKFKAQPTNAFFATVNQIFGSSSQLPTTAKHVVIKLLCAVQITKQCSAVVESWKEPPNT